MTKTYNDYGEILTLRQAAEFCGVSHPTFYQWLRNGTTPMGPIIEGTHFYTVGRDRKFVKRQLGLLFRMVD